MKKAVKKVLVDSVLGLWDVVNNLTRLQPSRRDRYRVTIFGSAQSKARNSRLRRNKTSCKSPCRNGL